MVATFEDEDLVMIRFFCIWDGPTDLHPSEMWKAMLYARDIVMLELRCYSSKISVACSRLRLSRWLMDSRRWKICVSRNG